MFYYTSFYRHRDASGKITGYTLRNEQTLEWMQVTAEQLKDAMINNRVHIFNLKLTSDGRIIEAPNPLQVQHQNNRLNEQNNLLSNHKLNDDNEDLGYLKNNIREDTLKRRVKHDGAFELNKIVRFFTGKRQGRVINTSGGWDEYNDPDGDGIIGEADGDGGDCD